LKNRRITADSPSRFNLSEQFLKPILFFTGGIKNEYTIKETMRGGGRSDYFMRNFQQLYGCSICLYPFSL
jgi:hypothetical protein